MIEVFKEGLAEDGPMIPRVLGAALLDSVLTDDKDLGEEDPPTDCLLGQAIDRSFERVRPLVLRQTTETFRREVLGE